MLTKELVRIYQIPQPIVNQQIVHCFLKIPEQYLLQFWIDEEAKKCFHPKVIDLMQNGKHGKLGSILRGIDVKSAVDHAGSTLLHLSAQYGTRYLTTFFIKVSKIDVNAQNDLGEAALMLACRNMNFEQIGLLLNAGADICLKDNSGMSSLMIVEYYRNVGALVELFVNHIKKICKSNVEIANLLLRAGCEVPYRFDAFKNAEITKIMLERGSPVNVRDKQYNSNSTLHAAVEMNDIESIKVLLQFGADKLIKNRSNSIPFIHAFTREKVNFKILELLIPDNVDWTEKKVRSEKMMLYPIFVSGTKKMLDLFLRRCNVDLKAKDNRGQTAIHYLVENENEGVWDLFENADFDVNARDNIGSTALHSACTLVNVDALRFLLDKGADVNALNDVGRSPLLNVFISRGILNFQAAKYHECIELLLQYNADVQIMDINRESLITHSIKFQAYDLHLPILAHLVLLEAIGAPINHFVKNPIMIDVQLRKAYELCKRQLDDMKKSKLYGSLSYFQLLTADDDQIANYAVIEDIEELLADNRMDNYYIRLLRKRILKAKKMIGLRKQAIKKKISSLAMDVDRSTSWFDCTNLDLFNVELLRRCASERKCLENLIEY